MAKLYFRYGAMGSGKTIDLLKVAYNYKERGKNVLIYTPEIDNRFGVGIVKTRIGLEQEAIVISKDMNMFDDISSYDMKISCILVDEANFLKKEQVLQLADVVDFLDIPVICYGLRADFRMELFEGSKESLAIADSIEEIKTICDCGKKATINARIIDGKVVTKGEQLFIGGNESYKSFCRRCYKEAINYKK